MLVYDCPAISVSSLNSTSSIESLRTAPCISIQPLPCERTVILSAPAVHSSDIDASAFDEPGGSYTPETMWLLPPRMITRGAEMKTHAEVFVSFSAWQPHCASQLNSLVYPSHSAVTCHHCE